MGMKWDEAKDCIFETKCFAADTVYDLNNKINDFIKEDYNVKESCFGKVIPLNISYDVQVEHEVGGPKNLMHYNKVKHIAILTYRFVRREYTYEEKIQRIIKALGVLRREIAKERILSNNKDFTEEMYLEAERRYDAGERV